MEKENKYYVYIYLDPRKPGRYTYKGYRFKFEPFYVGKGKGERMYTHLRGSDSCNKYKNNKIKKILKEGLSPIILKYKQNLFEEEAFKLEKRLIEFIGRKGLGPLTNLTEGGEGSAGAGKIAGAVHKLRLQTDPEYLEKHKKQSSEIFKRLWAEGKLVYIDRWTGRSHSQESIGRMKKAKENYGLGEANTQFGTYWITKEGVNKKIKKEELETFVLLGWVKGRIVK